MEPYNILFDQMEEDFGLEKHDSDDEEEEKNYIDNLDEIKQTVLEFQGCYVYSDYKIDPRIREGLGKLTLGQISMLNAKRRAKVIVDPEGIRGVKDGCLTVNVSLSSNDWYLCFNFGNDFRTCKQRSLLPRMETRSF